MLIDSRIRNCINVQYADINLTDIGKKISKNADILFCIYKGDKYCAYLDWAGLCMLSSQKELMEYIDAKSDHGWVYGLEMDKIERLFRKHQDTTIFLEKPSIKSKEIWTVNKIDVCRYVDNVEFTLYMKLKQKGIKAYIVNVPAEIKSVYGSFCEMMLTERWMKGLDDTVKGEIVNNLKRITELSYEEYSIEVLDKFSSRRQNKKLGNLNINRTIFLVGPCIVTGYSPSEKYMAEILNSLLEKFNMPYKIIKISSTFFPNELMEYDICQNDIVIFLGTGLSYKDYDLTEDYEQYDGIRNLCTNSTLHASQAGCELIANALMMNIIIPNYDDSDSTKDEEVLYVAEKGQLQLETEYEIKMYLKRIKIPRYMRLGNNGAIVMNANPYTIGHRQLVEYAASQVDRLFIFVVEEDVSFFSFKERFEMVLQGTRDIKNAIVIASGNFIISNKTFYDYFTKENDNGKSVDASKDILIFARYIAPYLNIKKRFVGEEPIDKVTEQYNEQMKKILPNYECELIEVPRFKSESEIISGSAVRNALQVKNIYYLRNVLPAASFNYIFSNIEALVKRNVSDREQNFQKAFLSDRMSRILEIVDFIKNEENIAIYGIGNDTLQCVKLLKNEDIEKIVFVDEKAETLELVFMGRKVISPYKLVQLYPNYNIIIFSSKYYKEIYYKCLDLGIRKEYIKYNPYNLYSDYILET